MVALPQLRDLTLEACDLAYEARYNAARKDREYLGMSEIGGECVRQIWYRFRWAARPHYNIASIKRFADGHATEEVAIDRLADNPALVVESVDPTTGEQFGFSDFGGHFRGHMDGRVIGLEEARKTPHVLEIKAVAEKEFTKLKRLIEKVGEKDALIHWNPVYYVQAQLYMHYGSYTRHFLVVCTPGAREWTSVRTDYHKSQSQIARSLAERVIFDERPPGRISEEPSYYLCSWCPAMAACHTNATLAKRNCRTCFNSTAERDGSWSCKMRPGEKLSIALQRDGCHAHAFNPEMLWDREANGHSRNDARLRTDIHYTMKSSGESWTDRGEG